MPQQRVLFLHPKTLIDSWPFPVDLLGEIVKVPAVVYPLLAATIRDLPVDVEIFDGYVSAQSFRAYKDRLRRADILCITVMTPLKALDTELTIRLARRLNPRVKVILGGNQATAFAERWLEHGADFVITGEGEIAFRRLIQVITGAGGMLDEVPNLVYRDAAGRPVRTHVPSPLLALDQSPVPAWELMDLRPYKPRLGPVGWAATVEISRGCPHRCDFCNINRFWGYSQRYKSVERVLDELDRLHRLGVRQIFFADDNFGHDQHHTMCLLEEMVRRGHGFAFGAFIRGDTVHRHPEFARLAARAGLRLAMMGIETLDPAWLKAHHKGVRARDVVGMWQEIYATLRELGVFLLGLFVHPMGPDEAGISGKGAAGKVCDYSYASDIIPQKNSALFEDLRQHEGMHLKDMFYHDWNLPSIEFSRGAQRNRKGLRHLLMGIDTHSLRCLVAGRGLERHFAWGNLLVVLERLFCTSADDLFRYRVANDSGAPLGERQRMIVESVLNERLVDSLVRSDYFKSPLSLRTILPAYLPSQR